MLDAGKLSCLLGRHAKVDDVHKDLRLALGLEIAPHDVIDFGRLVAVVCDEGGIGRGTLVQRAGETFSARTLFDAATPLLPGFAREVGFVF